MLFRSPLLRTSARGAELVARAVAAPEASEKAAPAEGKAERKERKPKREVKVQFSDLVVGKSFKNSVTASKVAAKEQWAADVKLPGMLHARMIHPKTLGSTLVSAGTLDKAKYPNSQVVVKGNLVGVVSTTEWEAIKAAQQVAAATKWKDWKGLPGHARLHDYLRRDADWKTTRVTKSDKTKGEPGPIIAAAPDRKSTRLNSSH